MRNLTVRRTKSFVGYLAKMKVYIENPISGDFFINNTPCSKLGELKNGEEKTFQIEDQPLKVFVIADKLSKNFCNDFYQLPAGQEDILLTGRNHFNLFNNAFRFDNNESEAVIKNRKRGTRIGLIVFSVAVVIGFIVGFVLADNFFSGNSKAKTFSSNGMNITLTEGFTEKSVEKYTVAYDSEKVAVFALKEPFEPLEDFAGITLDEYADLLIKANSIKSPQKKADNGLTWFEYDFDNTDAGETYRYYTYVYKAPDAFWFVQFATLKKDSSKNFKDITKWAKSVTFSDE